MTDKREAPWCGNCRFHSKQERVAAIAVASGEMETGEFEDEPTTAFICMHKTANGREIGLIDTHPGAGCGWWEEPRQKGLSPELEKLLKSRAG